jgi:hypothetical protein
MVFHFKIEEHAIHFQALLNEHKIKHERQVDEEGDKRIYFGVLKSDYKVAKRLNYLTYGHFRKPFITEPFFKYLLLIVTLTAVFLAFLGAITSAK